MTANQAIDTSAREHRTVTLYPETAAEREAMLHVLRVECADDCDAEETAESVTYWGANWRVEVAS